jgi:hypothetical protein
MPTRESRDSPSHCREIGVSIATDQENCTTVAQDRAVVVHEH